MNKAQARLDTQQKKIEKKTTLMEDRIRDSDDARELECSHFDNQDFEIVNYEDVSLNFDGHECITIVDSLEKSASEEEFETPTMKSASIAMDEEQPDFEDVGFAQERESSTSSINFDDDVEIESQVPSLPVVNFEHLVNIFESGEESIESMRGRDVILLIGKTGVGKSMFIQLLNGAKVEAKLYPNSKKKYEIVESTMLEGFAVGHETKSMTKSINAYTHSNGTIICDMPGYKDTHDLHIDIANSAWIRKIAAVCKSLRFIVIVHGATLEEDRGKPFRDLMQMFSNLISDKYEEVQNSVLVLFTHMSDMCKEELIERSVLKYIFGRIKEIHKQTPHKRAQDIMRNLANCIKKKTDMVRVLNPVTTNIFGLLSSIEKMPGIQDTCIICCSLVREVEFAVQLAVDRLETFIKEAMVSSLYEKQMALPGLLRLMFSIADILKIDKISNLAQELLFSISEASQNCQNEWLEVIDQAFSNPTSVKSLDVRAINSLLPQLSRYEILRAVVKELRPLHEPNFSEDGMIQNFQTKCFLLKLDVLRRLYFHADGVSLLIQLTNLKHLALIYNRIVIGKTSLQPLLPPFSCQFDVILQRLLGSEQTHRPREEIVTQLWKEIVSTWVETMEYVYVEMFKVFRQSFEQDRAPVEEAIETLQRYETDLIQKTFMSTFENIAMQATTYFKEVVAEITAFAAKNTLSTDEFRKLAEDVEKISSIQPLEKELLENGVTIHCEVLDGIDETVVGKLTTEFHDLHLSIFFKESKERLVAFAEKLTIFRDNTILCKRFGRSKAFMETMDSQIEVTVVKGWIDLKRNIDQSMVSENVDELRGYFKHIEAGCEAMNANVSGYLELQHQWSSLKDTVQSIVNKHCNIIRNSMKVYFVDWNHYLTAKWLSADDLHAAKQFMVERKYIDNCDCYCLENLDKLTFVDCDRLSALNEETALISTFQEGRERVLKFVPSYDESILRALGSLLRFDWFDAYHESAQSVAMTMARVRRAYFCRLQALKAIIQQMSMIDHDVLVGFIVELHKLRDLFHHIFNQNIDTEVEVIGELSKRVVKSECQDLRMMCIPITSLEQVTSQYPFKKVVDFISARESYRSVPLWQKDFEDIFEYTLRDCMDPLVTFIQGPLLIEGNVLEFKIDDLERIFVCEEKLRACGSLRSFVSKLYNYDNKNNSVQDVLEQELEAQLNNILRILQSGEDIEQVEPMLNTISAYIPLESWLKTKVSKLHQSLYTQFLSAQCAVEENIKKQVEELDFNGIRDHLDKINQRDNVIVYKKYTDIMNLIVPSVLSFSCSTIRNIQDGKSYANNVRRLRKIHEDIAGARGCYDHLLEYSRNQPEKEVDVEKILTHLNDLKVEHVNILVNKLKSAVGCEHIDVAAMVGSELLAYFDDLEEMNDRAVLINVKHLVKVNITDYLEWDGVSVPKEKSLAYQFNAMLGNLVNQEALASNGGISIPSLTNLLDQLHNLIGKVKHKDLAEVTNYETWRKYINDHLSEFFDKVVETAERDFTYSTSLNILKYTEAQFTSNFIKHLHMAKLKESILKSTTALEMYNKRQVSVFDTAEQCETCRTYLDKLYEVTKETFSSFLYTRFSYSQNAKVIRDRKQEYNSKIMSLQKLIDELIKSVDDALKIGNYKLAEKRYIGVLNAQEILSEHIKVSTEEVVRTVKDLLKQFRDRLLNAAAAKEVSLIILQFPKFLFFRECAHSLQAMGKADIIDCGKVHDAISDLLGSLEKEFIESIKSFKFNEVIKLVDLIDRARQFTQLQETIAYCKKFAECDFVIVTIIQTRVGSRHSRQMESYNDGTVVRLDKMLYEFLPVQEVTQYMKDSHQHLIEFVGDVLNNREYFRLKSVNESLLSFHLLADMGGGIELINETKGIVRQMIQENLNALRKDVSNFWMSRNYAKLNDSMNTLHEAEHELKQFSGYTDDLQIVRTALENELKKVADESINTATSKVGDYNERIRDFSQNLIEIGKVYDQVQMFHTLAEVQLRRVLNHCQEKLGLCFIFKLGVILEEGKVFDDDPDRDLAVKIAKQIVGNFNHFRDVNVMTWNKRAVQHGVDKNLGELMTFMYNPTSRVSVEHPFDRTMLKAAFDLYESEYNGLVANYIGKMSQMSEMIDRTRILTDAMKPCSVRNWKSVDKSNLPKILAGIFAYYTISKCGDSFNSLGDNGDASVKKDILLMPHNIQVLTILHLLGCAQTASVLENHLMQIGTGEGKSIILGALATVFGMLGFEVQCVCYSEYLSSRDFSDFKDIFRAFGCLNSIVYSKITAFSEALVAAKGDIRKLTSDLIMDSRESGSSQSSASANETNDSSPYGPSEMREDAKSESRSVMIEKILLVDEVDVFFGKDFYGQTYNQVTTISMPEIIAIIRTIWNERNSHPNLARVASLNEYQSLVSKYSEWKELFDSEIRLMCAQVKLFDQPAYHYDPSNDRVGYHDHDTISYNLSYGYRTVFAYLRELDRGAVRSEFVKAFGQHLQMQISCGQFLYTNINPACILGVSGTLMALTEYEKDVMSRFNIQLSSVSPSVYGAKNFVFDKADTGIHVADNVPDFFKKIADDINKYSRTADASKMKERAIVVFFENIARMDEFRSSEYYRQIIDNTSVNRLTEEDSKDARDYMIQKAARIGQVTLSTKVFGRGMDFISRDQVLDDKGGVHIIQTFLSEMLSEEIQVQGRTARQGQSGSYSMVLLLQDQMIQDEDGNSLPKTDTLQHFGVDSLSFSNVARADRYEYLSKMRDRKRMHEADLIEEALEKAVARDTLTHKYFNALLSHNRSNSIALFRDLYKLLKGGMTQQLVAVHIVFVMDESGSMDGSPFNELNSAYRSFISQRQSNSQASQDVVSVIMFDDAARCIARMVSLNQAPNLSYKGGGTSFYPALQQALYCLQADPSSVYVPIIIFMTDGGCDDLPQAVSAMQQIDRAYSSKGLQVNLVAFGSCANMECLRQLKEACTDGHIHPASIGALTAKFKEIEQSLPVGEYK